MTNHKSHQAFLSVAASGSSLHKSHQAFLSVATSYISSTSHTKPTCLLPPLTAPCSLHMSNFSLQFLSCVFLCLSLFVFCPLDSGYTVNFSQCLFSLPSSVPYVFSRLNLILSYDFRLLFLCRHQLIFVCNL